MDDRRIVVLAVAFAGCQVNAVIADDAGDPFATGSTGAVASTEDSSSGGPVDPSGDETTGTTSGADDEESTGYEGPKLDVQSDETGGPVSDCDDDEPDLIHVMTTDREIWTFDPIEIEFALLTTVTCLPMESQISGFAIDRDGLITVLSYEPQIVDPSNDATMQLSTFFAGDADCEVLFQGPLGQGMDCGDLSLVSTADDPDHERLFIHSCTGGGFTVASDAGKVFRSDPDDAPVEIEMLASNEYTSVPIAGTSDGRLFGVSGDQDTPNSTRWLEFDPETGIIFATTPVPEIDIGSFGFYFALAFYAGDLFTFGLSNASETIVYRYDWDDDDGNGEHEVTQLEGIEPLPFAGSIFAAASPTCIPLTPAG